MEHQEESVQTFEHQYPPDHNEHRRQQYLSPEQQERVKTVLYEESGAFSRDSGDIGCIPSLQMEVRVKDDTPAQRAYASIPKPLYREVKEHVQELLVKGWIVKSQSTTLPQSFV